MLYFRTTNILLLVLASLSSVTAQNITDAPVSAAGAGAGADAADVGLSLAPIFDAADNTPTEAPVVVVAGAGGVVDTTPVTDMPILGGVGTPTETPSFGAATTTPPIFSGVETPTEAPVAGTTEMPILGGVGTPTNTPTSAMPSGNTPTGGEPTPIAGADYCTVAPDPTCYSNNGKPDCCLDDAVDCPADTPPCDVSADTAAPSAPPTPQSTDTSIVVPTATPTVGGDTVGNYCTYAPNPTCYSNNGRPECCMDDTMDCPDEAPPCDVVVVGTETPTPAPYEFAGFQKCSANDVCQADGLEGNCCPNEDGKVLDCCYGITNSPTADTGANPTTTNSPTSMPSGKTPTGGPGAVADVPTDAPVVPVTDAPVVPDVPTNKPPLPPTPTQDQTPPAPVPGGEPNDNTNTDSSGSSSSSTVEIDMTGSGGSAVAVVSAGRFIVAVAAGVVTAAIVVVF